MEETYPQVREFAKQEGARVRWVDECGFRSDHQTGTTYGRKGQTPVVPSSGYRFSCNMVSAIDNAGHLAFKMFEGGFTGEVCIDFMKRLTKCGAQKVFLIMDNLSVHKSDKVRQWVEKNSSCIRLFFLPKYSPDLNPVEYVNNDVKSNAVGRRRARDKKELKSNVSAYLCSTQKRPSVIKSFFLERHVRYAAV
jgi:transposase